MNSSELNDRLNDLLIDLNKSLLQYAQEAWPWSGREESETVRQQLKELAASQRQSAAELVDLLDRRGHFVDLGTYPEEYTSLHYVSLEYLLDLLAVNASDLVETIEAVRQVAAQDEEAASLLDEILKRQRAAAEELATLSSAAKSAAAASA